MVNNGEVDAFFSLKKSPEREEELLFTKRSLIRQPFVFFPNIDEAQSFEQNIKKLVAGRVDLIINSHDVGHYILKKIRADTAIIALYPPVDGIDSYLAFT